MRYGKLGLMIEVSKMVVDNVVIPEDLYDLSNASADPLTCPSLLREIFTSAWEDVETKKEMYPSYLSGLAGNPSLPPDVFEALLEKSHVYGRNSRDKILTMDILSYFLSNPLITFEQVLSIVHCVNMLGRTLSSVELNSCKTVVEIFDKLILVEPKRSNFFLTKLLCGYLVSDEDFKSRVENNAVRAKLDNWCLLDNSRFTPRAVDYASVFSFITNGQGKLERGILGIIFNENATPEFLVKVLKHKGSHKDFVYENLVCPIELSASYHIAKLHEYKWRLSYVVKLEAKVDEYLVKTQGEGPWSDLPLSWKLDMVAG